MQHYSKLQVWRMAHGMVLGIYRLTRFFPTEERYGLRSQLRRAAVSVTANIAEGSARYTVGEYMQALSVAHGSAAEVEYLLLLSKELGLQAQEIDPLLRQVLEVSRMLSALRARIRMDR